MPTPIHNHTYFSAYDGLSKPLQIAERVTELGYEACGCTDHDVVAGHLEFYRTMNDKGIKPLLGVETYQSPITRFETYGAQSKDGWRVDNFHLILLAMNKEGLNNLWGINSEAHRTGHYYHARVDWDLLQEYNEGLIATSACGLGMIQQSLHDNPNLELPEFILQKYLKIFGDRFYLELSTYPEEWQKNLNIQTVGLATEFGIPLIYANDAHYSTPDQYELHEAIVALSEQKKLKDPTEDEDPKKGRTSFKNALYIMSEEETREHLSYLSKSIVDSAIEGSDVVASRCEVSLPEFKQHVPVFIPDSGYVTNRQMMLDLVEKGFKEKIATKNLDINLYFERVQKELEVIFGANLVDYLLSVRDYVVWARNQDIMVGPGRGSVGGSLVAYLIDITQVDPIRYDLIFERFYNAGREKSLPDIDIDFAASGREKVKGYITEKYGAKRVADIGTVSRLHPMSAVKDIARVLSHSFMDAQRVSDILEKAIDAGLQPDWDEINAKLATQLEPFYEKYPDVFEWAIPLSSETEKGSKDQQVKTYGVHATGVLISDVELGRNFPLRSTGSGDKKKLVTQWDMRDAEKLGFMKADLCSLRNLDTLSQLNLILEETGREPIPFYDLQDWDFPAEMWTLLDKGKTIGLFQIEDKPAVKQIAKAMKPRSIEDLSVLGAMNRPGPLRSKDKHGVSALDRYFHGRNGGEPDYINSVVEEVTKETYGIFLYQEQVINLMIRIGYSLMEADDVRSIMGKKKKEKIEAEYERYFPRAIQHMNEDDAQEIWNQLLEFSKYGFNKSHAVAYAIITLWTLYAKWKYPAEFLAASIRTVEKDKKARYVNEAKVLKIPVYLPEFGNAKALCSLHKGGIMLGYWDILGVGEAPARWLEENAVPGLSREELETMALEKKQIQSNGKKKKAIAVGQIDALEKLGLFGNEMAENERIAIEEELLKVAISDNSAKILEEYSTMIEEDCVPYSLIEDPGEYTIAGIIRSITNSKTKHNKPYARVKISDLDSDELEFFVWNKELSRLNFIFRHRTAGLFYVKRDHQGRFALIDAAILHTKKKGDTLYERI